MIYNKALPFTVTLGQSCFYSTERPSSQAGAELLWRAAAVCGLADAIFATYSLKIYDS